MPKQYGNDCLLLYALLLLVNVALACNRHRNLYVKACCPVWCQAHPTWRVEMRRAWAFTGTRAPASNCRVNQVQEIDLTQHMNTPEACESSAGQDCFAGRHCPGASVYPCC
jgi:hypothetical protein